MFLDESAFYLLPGVTRTWAPKGETPILRSKLSRDHLSVISAITPEGALFFQTRDAAFDSAAVIDFLELLLAQIAGKLLIIWDGAPIHRSKAIKGYLAAGAAKRIRLERLPAYAPDLNPDEAIWHHLKHVELNNFPCRDLPHLCQELLAAFARLARRPDLIKACFYQLGYYDKST